MPRNSSGVYSKPSGTTAVANERATSSSFNTAIDDLGEEITASLPRNGAAAMSGNLPMGGNRITNVAEPTSNADGATKTYVDGQISTRAASSHTHVIGDVTDLQTTLDGKAPLSHTHAIADVTDAGALASRDDITTSQLATGFGTVIIKDSEIDSTTSATNISSSTFPFDDTIPQRGQGTEILGATYTPEESGTLLDVEVELQIGGDGGTNNSVGAVALFESTSDDALHTAMFSTPPTHGSTTVRFVHRYTSAGVAIAFSVRIGLRSASLGGAYLNGHGLLGGRIFGGALKSFIRVREHKTI